MKRLLFFWFFCVSLHCFGMLSEEQIREADDFPRPKEPISSLLSRERSTVEGYFIKFCEGVKTSDLIPEQKVHLYVWIFYCACIHELEQTQGEVYSLLTDTVGIEQVALYLLNFVDNPRAEILQWNVQKYIQNRGPILAAMTLIRDNVGKLTDKETRRLIIHRYNQLGRDSF